MCSDCVGRPETPTAPCEMCVDKRLASPSQFSCGVCIALESARFRRAPVDDYEDRRDPMAPCNDVFAACPRMADIFRAAPGEIRNALPRVRRHLPPPNMPRLKGVVGLGGEVPSKGTSLCLMAAHTCGAGPCAKGLDWALSV